MRSGQFVAKNSGRLDKVLSVELEVSRNQVEKLIKEGLVKVDNKTIIKPSFKLEELMGVSYVIKQAPKEDFSQIDIDIETLYEDEDILVVNKPAGLVVHPAPSVKEPTLVDWLRRENFRLSTISGEERNGIVHRLDKDTSGAILIAKSNMAHEVLSRQLQDRSMGRYYLAVINYPLKDEIIVQKPIARNPKNRLKMAVVAGGRASKTAFAKLVQSSNTNSELIACKLFSGRTHQIRVHLGSLNRFVLGDKLYGSKEKVGTRMLLHAYLLYFIHPITKERIEIIAPLFEDMHNYITTNFNKGKEYESPTKESIKQLFENFAS